MYDPTNTPGSNGSPPPSPPHLPHDVTLMIGRLLERSDHTLAWMRSVDGRLASGDRRMSDLARDIHAVKTRVPVTVPEPVPGWEIAIKRPLPWIIGLLALAVTGKLELAVKLLEALGKIAVAIH